MSELRRQFTLGIQLTLLAWPALISSPAHAIVTPTPDRAFGTNAAGRGILTQMVDEAANPALWKNVVRFINNAPVDVFGDGAPDFRTWSGTLIASNWVLTCAHALQGTNGLGGGIQPGRLDCFTDNGLEFEVVEFFIRSGWQKEQYLLGNDLALVRLRTNVTHVEQFPRLAASPLVTPAGVVIVGFGAQGNGDTGGDDLPGVFNVGINTFDVVGGAQTRTGSGILTNLFPNTPSSVAFMDFDKWTNVPFACLGPMNVPFTNAQAVVLSSYSFMGEYETSNPVQACPSPIQAAPGYIAATVCDFMPAAGDSGGPAFRWPGYPASPAAGYYVSGVPLLLGLVSFGNPGAGTTNNSVYGNVFGYTLVQPHLTWIYQTARAVAEQDSDGDGQSDEAEFLAGTDPYVVPAVPAAFNAAPGYGTALDSLTFRGHEVAVYAVTLAGETTEPDGRVLLSFHAALRNTGGGYHQDLRFALQQPAPPAWPVELVTSFVQTPDLAPTVDTPTIANTPMPVSLRCAAADVATVKAAVLNKQRVAVRSVELFQFCSPIVTVDMATDDAYQSHLAAGTGTNKFATIVFSSDTPLLAALTPGTLLLENPSTAGYRLKRPGPAGNPHQPGLYQVIHAAEAYGPLEIAQEHKTELLLVTAIERTNGVVRLSGYVRELYVVLCAGTEVKNQLDAFDDPARDPYNPPHGNSLFTGSEWHRRDDIIAAARQRGPRAGELADLLGFFTLHFPFNDVKLGPGITLDGEYLLRGLNLDLAVTWRNALISKVAMTVTMRTEANLRLTAEGGANNGGLTLLEKERTLVYAPLPPIVIPIASFPLELAPALTVKVGCEVTAGSRIVVPLQNSAEAGFYMAWDSTRPLASQFVYEPIHEITAVASSPPTLSQALQASANVWIEGGLEVLVQGLAGPYIATRASGGLTLDPTANPWWSLTGDLDLRGGLRFRFLGFEIADPGGSVLRGPGFLNRNPGDAFTGTNPTQPLDNVEGDHVRWSRLLKWNVSTPDAASACRVPGTAEDMFLMLHSASGSTLTRLNATGAVVWAVGSLLWNPKQIAATPDAGVIVAGNSGIGGLFIQKFNGAGGQVWSNSLAFRGATNQTQNPYLAKVLVRETGGGSHEIFVVGHRDRGDHPGGTWGGGTLDTDPFILKYDASGALQWSRILASVDSESVADALVRRDGGLLLCGSHKLSPDGTNVPGPGIPSSGWLMWVNPDGSFDQARRSVSAFGMTWSGVTEAPDATLYTCGQRSQTVLFSQPVLQVGKYNPQGDLLAMVTLGETLINSADPLDYAAMGRYEGHTTVQANPSPTDPSQTHNGLRDWLPDAGLTPWDEGVRIAWTPAGIIVAGNTALGVNRAPLTASLNESLSARWFTTHERLSSDDRVFDLEPTTDGVLVVGGSTQLFDLTGATPASLTNGSALLLKLPFDGKIELHSATRTVHRFLQPGVHDSLYDEEDVGIPSPNVEYLGTFPVSLTTTNQITIAGTMPPALTPTANLVSVPLEAGNSTLPMSYAQWAGYNFVTGGSNSGGGNPDGDALLNGAEYFFGTDPLTATPASVGALTIDYANAVVGLEFQRARAATNAPFAMQFSTNLVNWQVVTNGTLQTTGTSNLVDRLRLTLPAPAPAAFFRLNLTP